MRLLTALSLLAVAVLVPATPALAAVTPVPGDPLTGSGAVVRTLLTATDLQTGASTSPVSDAAFALPTNAAPPAHTFEGRLTLTGEASGGGFTELRDDYSYTNATDSPRKHLPEIDLQFVQNGSHLVPVAQGLSITGHAYWNLIAGPGRAWHENGDGASWSRAALPFALVQRNANCTHNGVMTFLFNASSVSKVRYQITQETCQYFKFNQWGQLAATYTPGVVAGAEAIKNAHAAEVGDRLPTKPISALATDYPGAGINTATFGSGLSAQHTTFYGFLYNGVNYVSGCTTRFGAYAFCDAMRAPSYSTAKSAFASLAQMRLAQKFGTNVGGLLVRNYVPEYATANGNWTNVTIDHALDMATGNYTFAGFESDEGGALMSDFFLAEPYGTKIAKAFGYASKVAPGTKWVYHSSDTFIATRAMGNYLGSDLFNLVRDEVFTPIKLSGGAKTSVRTDNSATGVPFGGYGLFWTPDDVAKVAKLFNNDNGAAAGTQLLSPALLANAMQRNPADRGLVTSGTTPFRYNNGLWAKQVTAADGYACSFYVPFMSGYGGITVAMMPNGATYYYESDNNEFAWMGAVGEANKLTPFCPS